ncbi:MAG TPA: hypothetical protein VGH20_08755 [Myxococcales bacterium]
MSATLTGARGLFGDGPINLLRARDEVHALLQATGGVVPFAPACTDALAPLRVPSVAAGNADDRVLAEIDQDGFAFAVDEQDVPFFNRREERRPRQQNLLDIVLLDGRVCVRKRFRALRKDAVRWGRHSVPAGQRMARAVWTRLGLFLYSEAAALLRLHDLPFVPKLRHIDFEEHALYVDFLDGESLRHRAAKSGAAVHDKDLAAQNHVAALTARDLDRREVDLLDLTHPGDFRSEIAAMIAQINHRGVAPLDIKLGNFVRGTVSGRLYWLDFEISRLETQPRWHEDLALQNEILEELFGQRGTAEAKRTA